MSWQILPKARTKQLVLEAVHGETKMHRELAGSTLTIQIDHLHSEIEHLRGVIARMEQGKKAS